MMDHAQTQHSRSELAPLPSKSTARVLQLYVSHPGISRIGVYEKSISYVVTEQHGRAQTHLSSPQVSFGWLWLVI